MSTPEDPQLARAKERLKQAEARRARERRRVAKLESQRKRAERKLHEERCFEAGRILFEAYGGTWTHPKFLTWIGPHLRTKRQHDLFGLPEPQAGGGQP